MDSKKSEKAVNKAGVVLLTCPPLLIIGYYLGDIGLRWYPQMVSVLLLCLLMGFGSFFISTFIHNKEDADMSPKLKRKRTILWALILITAFTLLLSCRSIEKKTPLTALTPEQFDRQLTSNLELLTAYDRELDALLDRIQQREDFPDDNTETLLNADQEKFVRQCWLSFYDYAYAVDQIHDFYSDWYRFDVSRSERRYHVQSFLMVCASDCVLYEKTYQIIHLFKQNPNIVKFLNSPHPDSEIGPDSFSRVQRDLFGIESNARIHSARAYLKWLQMGLDAKHSDYSGICSPLWPRIERIFAVIYNIDLFDHSKEVLDADFEIIRQGVDRVWFPAQKGVAEWMGDSRIKRAGQYLITPELQEAIEEKLIPGDVILSRKNWYLSNVGLPGFWPHAILYIGTPEQLNAYFDTPEVALYLEKTTGQAMTFDQYMSRKYPHKWLKYKAGTGESKYHAIEAIKYGVVLNPLDKACGDYLVALRPRLDQVAKAQAIIEAFKHLDKPYDFDFDFATDHALVCTELVWRSYRPDVNKQGLVITPVEVAGRKTLPANEIAKLYVNESGKEDSQFDFVLFIDANESDAAAFLSDEESFKTTVERSKWSFSQQ